MAKNQQSSFLQRNVNVRPQDQQVLSKIHRGLVFGQLEEAIGRCRLCGRRTFVVRETQRKFDLRINFEPLPELEFIGGRGGHQLGCY